MIIQSPQQPRIAATLILSNIEAVALADQEQPWVHPVAWHTLVVVAAAVAVAWCIPVVAAAVMAAAVVAAAMAAATAVEHTRDSHQVEPHRSAVVAAEGAEGAVHIPAADKVAVVAVAVPW